MRRVEVACDRPSVVRQGMSKAEAARRFGVSQRWVHELVRRYEAGGVEALEPRSRRPKTNPHQTPDELRAGEVLSTHTVDANRPTGAATKEAPADGQGFPI